MQVNSSPIVVSEANLKLIDTLVSTSHRSSLEVEFGLPWEQGVDKSIAPKRPEHAWLYGTRFWDQLSPAEQHELLWLENGRDVTAFIALERFLPVLYVGYINKYGPTLPREIYDYLMIFSKEEIVHTMIFKRYMKVAGLPLIQDPESPYKEFIAQVMELPPIYGIFFTLIVEWAAELNAMHLTQFDEAEPFTKRMMRAHHVEEVRHIAFGKRLVEDYIAQASPEELQKIRSIFMPIAQGVYAELTYNRLMGNYTSFKFPVAHDDQAAIDEIRNSPHNKELNAIRFREMNEWLGKLWLQ